MSKRRRRRLSKQDKGVDAQARNEHLSRPSTPSVRPAERACIMEKKQALVNPNAKSERNKQA